MRTPRVFLHVQCVHGKCSFDSLVSVFIIRVVGLKTQHEIHVTMAMLNKHLKTPWECLKSTCQQEMGPGPKTSPEDRSFYTVAVSDMFV